MKLLHIITDIEFGGAEKQLLILARHQARNGYQVDVAYLKGYPEMSDAFEKANINIHKDFANITPIFQIYKLRRLIHQHNYDLIHAHLPRAELIFALSQFLIRKHFPAISSKHNSEMFFPKAPKPISRILSRFSSRSFESHIFISNSARQFAFSSGEISSQKSNTIIPYAYDSKNGLSSPRSIFGQHRIRFLFLGRFEKQKNLPFLIHCFREHKRFFPEDTLTLVGRGSEEEYLRRISSGSIEFLERTSDVDVYYKSHDCLILPSSYEGFGLVLLEAMVFGIPILCSNVSSMPEVLGKDYRGLFDPQDPSSLLSLMNELHDGDYFDSLAKYCSNRLHNFEIEQTHSAIENQYLKLLGQRT